MNQFSLIRGCIVLAAVSGVAAQTFAAIQLSESPVAGSGVLNFQIAPDSSRVLYRIQMNAAVGFNQQLFSAPTDAAGMQIQLSNSLVPDDAGVVSGGVLFTPDSSAAVYSGDLETDGHFEMFSTSTTTAGTQVKLNSAPAHANVVTNQAKLVPDGTRVLYRSDLDSDNVSEVYSALVGMAGTQIRLTNAPVADGDVAVNDFFPTPDGLHVVYLGDLDTDGVDELYSASTTAANTQIKLNDVSPVGGDIDDDFLITSDGGHVIYRGQLGAVPLVNELYRAPVDSSGMQIKLSDSPTTGFSGANSLFRLTPDGARVVYTGRFNGSEANELYSAPTDTANMQIKLNDTPVEGGAVGSHQLTPDGARAVFRGDLLVVGQNDLFSAPVDMAGQQVQLNTNTAGGNVGFFVAAPGSSRVLYAGDMNTLGQAEIYSAPADAAGMQITLSTNTAGSGGVGSVFLSPDGTRVGYTGTLTTAGIFDLYVASTTAESTQVALTNLPANQFVSAAEFTPDGQFVVYTVDTDGDFAADALFANDALGMNSPVQLNDPLIAGGRITQFLVSPDSQTVVYRANQDDLAVFNLFAASLAATPIELPGDYNGNGIVDAADYTTWRDTLGQSVDMPGDGADGDESGEVDAGDYTYWVERFGNVVSEGGASAHLAPGESPGANLAVPEPAGTLMATIAVLMTMLPRRRAN
jgi:hypothetical protein